MLPRRRILGGHPVTVGFGIDAKAQTMKEPLKTTIAAGAVRLVVAQFGIASMKHPGEAID